MEMRGWTRIWNVLPNLVISQPQITVPPRRKNKVAGVVVFEIFEMRNDNDSSA